MGPPLTFVESVTLASIVIVGLAAFAYITIEILIAIVCGSDEEEK